MRLIYLAILFALLATAVARAQPCETTVVASTCEFDDVSAAVAAAAPGMTVQIPGGDCTWGTQQLAVPAGIHLRGAGLDVTIIRRSGNVTNSVYLVRFDCSNGGAAELSNMSLFGNGDGGIQDIGLGLVNGCQDFKVYNSRFSKFTFSGIYVGDAPGQRGVIFNNRFIKNYSPSLGNLGYGVVIYGGGAWPALDLGSRNAVFIEDNYFTGNRHDVASNNGASYVFRNNTVVGRDAAKDFAMTDAHGRSSSPRGTRSYEIYDNHYLTNLTSGLQRAAIGIRGGDGVIFNNIAVPTIARTVELWVEGFPCGIYPGPDQIRSLYIWNNTANPSNGYTTNGISNNCPASILEGRDYFLVAKPGYVPFSYPHPLRHNL
jgi:hypothetical protein